VCVCVCERERERERFMLRNWLLPGLTSLKSTEQAGGLEISTRVNAAVLSPKSVCRQEFLFLQGASIFSLKSFS